MRASIVDPPDRLPFDRYQRYAFTTRVVEALRDGEQALRVLEVGANVHYDLEKFLPLDQVTYLDLERPTAADERFVQGDATTLPFRSAAFDIVLAMDVLEHILPGKRPDFLAELLRTAGRAVLIAAPFRLAAVEAQEIRLTSYYCDLYGSEYPWLAEHRLHGLPDLDDTLRQLKPLGWHCSVWGHGNLELWTKLIQVHLYVNSEPDLLPLRSEIDRFYNSELFSKDWDPPVYRQFLLLTPTPHDHTLCEQLFDTTQRVSGPDLLRLQEYVDRLYEQGDRRRYRQFREGYLHALGLKDNQIHQVEAQVRNLETQLRARNESAARNERSAARRIEEYKAENAVLRLYLAHESRWKAALQNSLSWRLTAPFRKAQTVLGYCRRFLRWRLHRIQLEPIYDLVLEEDETFRSTGDDPQFLLHSSKRRLPTAWVVFSYEMEAQERSLDPKLYVDSGYGFAEDQQFALPFRTKGKVEWKVRLPNQVYALRLDPLSAPGRFTMRNMTVQELGGLQVAATLLWSHLQPVVSDPQQLGLVLKKAWRVARTEGFRALQHRLLAPGSVDYQQWVVAYDTFTEHDRALIRSQLELLSYKPLISIILPAYNTPEKWLRRAIESVRNQVYLHWELCIADDASTAPHVRQVLEEYRDKDARIKVMYRERNGHISAASNSAIALASGEFIALLDHDDELAAHALSTVVAELNAYPDADLLYSDEDKIDAQGRRFHPYFKPDWNPDLFLAQNLVTHLCVCRASLVREVGGFHTGYEGAQDWDLVMRIVERIPTTHIRHIPHVLYHWRAIPGSTALAIAEKDYARDAQHKMLVAHFARIEQPVEILPVAGACWRIQYPLPQPPPLVTLIIPTRDRFDLLRRCVESIYQKTTYPHFEVLIVDNQSTDPRTLAYLQQLSDERGVQVLPYDAPFNYSAINNYAVGHARGTVIGLLNNDLEVISPDWLTEMVSQALRPEIGTVGAMLYYPNDTIQHAGVILGLGTSALCAHAFIYRPRGYPGPVGRALLNQNLSAVTAACMVLRKAVFVEVGGLDETNLAVAYNDVDLCLRLMEKGYRNLWTPNAELYHHESASRGAEDGPEKQARFQQEIAYMKERWHPLLLRDPAYNPNLALDRESFTLAFPPRVQKPWAIEKVVTNGLFQENGNGSRSTSLTLETQGYPLQQDPTQVEHDISH